MKSFALVLLAGIAYGNWSSNPWEQAHAKQRHHSYGANPWQHGPPKAPTKPAGWWSATQQYSPPKIPFIPAKLHKTEYGICQFEDDNANTIVINLGQAPGYPAMVKGELEGAALATAAGNNEAWDFAINKYGNIGGMDCANTGPEFNPLAEFIYGQPNPFADPTRGTLNSVTIAPDANNMQKFEQDKLLQNLGGKNSIIGKSVKVTVQKDDGMGGMMTEVIGCCVIGQADSPMVTPPAAPHQGHNPHQAHGHGVHNPHQAHGHGHGHGWGPAPRRSYGQPRYGQYGGYNRGYGGQGGFGGHGRYGNRGW